MTHTTRAFFALAALAPLAGCEELDGFLPDVTFRELAVNDISFESIDTDFVFDVNNPNPVQISLADFSYSLDLEKVNLLSGDNKDGFTLESVGSSELRLPVGLVWNDVYETVQATTGEDNVGFRLEGGFGFDTGDLGLGVVELPYDEKGDFPALRTPKFSFQALRVTNLDLTSADLAVDLGVTNDHESNLIFQNFDYALQLDGSDVAAGVVDSFEVEGAALDATTGRRSAGSGKLTLPISIDLLTAGITIVDAIVSGGKLDLGLQAGMDVDTPFGVVPLDIDEAANMLLEGL